MKHLVLITLGITMLATGLYKLILIGIERQIAHECAVWQEQSELYSDYYWTNTQIDQCHPKTFVLPNGNAIPYRNDAQKYNQY
jgi:hypothetical protein